MAIYSSGNDNRGGRAFSKSRIAGAWSALQATRKAQTMVSPRPIPVYDDKHGRRTSSLPACSSRQLTRAADAMASYRREQGMN
jgi:hypothetical protein